MPPSCIHFSFGCTSLPYFRAFSRTSYKSILHYKIANTRTMSPKPMVSATTEDCKVILFPRPPLFHDYFRRVGHATKRSCNPSMVHTHMNINKSWILVWTSHSETWDSSLPLWHGRTPLKVRLLASLTAFFVSGRGEILSPPSRVLFLSCPRTEAWEFLNFPPPPRVEYISAFSACLQDQGAPRWVMPRINFYIITISAHSHFITLLSKGIKQWQKEYQKSNC